MNECLVPFFFSYAYPSPDRFSEAQVRPAAATWSADLGEFAGVAQPLEPRLQGVLQGRRYGVSRARASRAPTRLDYRLRQLLDEQRYPVGAFRDALDDVGGQIRAAAHPRRQRGAPTGCRVQPP